MTFLVIYFHCNLHERLDALKMISDISILRASRGPSSVRFPPQFLFHTKLFLTSGKPITFWRQ